MHLMHDGMIRALARGGMIEPLFEGQTRPISNGIGSFGYDATLGSEFRYLRPSAPVGTMIDPHKLSPAQIDNLFLTEHADYMVIQPASFVLGHSVEMFHIPTNVLGICLGKSSLARFGIICNVTPLEPGWSGQVTIEISNLGPYPFVIHAGDGIVQIIFLQNETPPQKPYPERGAKYQHQRGVVLPRVRMVDTQS